MPVISERHLTVLAVNVIWDLIEINLINVHNAIQPVEHVQDLPIINVSPVPI